MSDSDLELYGIVGKMFREIRESRDLSLEIVAEYLKIAPKSLQRYECGERKIKMGTIKELCFFYKIQYDDFIKEAKLRFGKNLYTDDSSEQEKSPKILKYYEQLNDIGKNEATKRVEELTYIQKYTDDFPEDLHDQEQRSETEEEKSNNKVVPMMSEDDPRYVNAAHAIDGASEEDIQFDEDIMDDENF